MNSDAALDQLAFLVGLRLMGADERRRLRIALACHPDFEGTPGFDIAAAERLDDLLLGRRAAETLQDRIDLRRASRQRAEAPFSPAFWARRVADLSAAGFSTGQAETIVAEVRKRVEAVDTTTEGDEHAQLEEA